MPEGFYALAHATLYLATAPKSNSVGTAYGAALEDVRETRNDPVPLHLRNAPTGLMRALGYGKEYHYAHDDYDVVQANLPENLAGRRYYRPGNRGDEARIAEWLKKRAKKSGPSELEPLFPVATSRSCALELRTSIMIGHDSGSVL